MNSVQEDFWRRAREAFLAALDEPESARAACLDRLCGGDANLRREVEALLRSHAAADDDFLHPPPPPPDPIDAADARAAATTESPAATDPWLGRRIDGFHVTETLATGGMGVVYLAEQDHPRRRVALKVLRSGLLTRSALRRFEYEAQLLARLVHPHIAQIYQAGEADGAPYFAMEYVSNALPITTFAAEHALSLKQRLELFLQVCDAVQHGHQRGILHRDLKPANILVTNGHGAHADVASPHAGSADVSSACPGGTGVQPADLGGTGVSPVLPTTPQVKIIDFGVARATDADVTRATLVTETGQLIGTLQYMSPEQCAADPLDLDIRSDVYALGVVLYELLCGRLPYDVTGASLATAARIICEIEPPRPSAIARRSAGPPSPAARYRISAAPAARAATRIRAATVRERSLSRPISAATARERGLSPSSSNQEHDPGASASAEPSSLGPSVPGFLGPSASPPPSPRLPAPCSVFPVKGNLEHILLTALAKDRTRRYQSVADLHRDIRHYLAGEPIEAKRPTVWTRVARWSLRHPIAMTTGTCVLIVVVMFVATYASIWWFNHQPHRLVLLNSDGTPVARVGVEAQLRSRSGVLLHSWLARGRDSINSATLINPQTDSHDTKLAVLAFSPVESSDLRGSLCAYDASRPESPLWIKRLHDADLLPVLRDERHILAANYGPFILACEDIFPGKAAPGVEIVTYFAGTPASAGVIRIYNTDGDILYQVWQDGGIGQCQWKRDSGLLVFVGTWGVVPWEARGKPNGRLNYSGHPTIVFAVRPKLGFIESDCLRETPRAGADAEPLHPEWLLCVVPPNFIDIIGPSPRFQIVGTGFGAHDRTTAVSLEVAADLGICIIWHIDEHGRVPSGGRVVTGNPFGAPPDVQDALSRIILAPMLPIRGHEDDPPCLTPREYWNNAPQ